MLGQDRVRRVNFGLSQCGLNPHSDLGSGPLVAAWTRLTLLPPPALLLPISLLRSPSRTNLVLAAGRTRELDRPQLQSFDVIHLSWLQVWRCGV